MKSYLLGVATPHGIRRVLMALPALPTDGAAWDAIEAQIAGQVGTQGIVIFAVSELGDAPVQVAEALDRAMPAPPEPIENDALDRELDLLSEAKAANLITADKYEHLRQAAFRKAGL